MRQCVKCFENQPQGGAIINIINHPDYTSVIARNTIMVLAMLNLSPLQCLSQSQCGIEKVNKVNQSGKDRKS